MNRRQILKHGALAGAASIAPIATAATAKSLSSNHTEITKPLAAYSNNVTVNEQPDGSVKISVSLDNLQAFQDDEIRQQALLDHLDSNTIVTANGNSVRYEHQGRQYEIQHLMPASSLRATS